MKKILIATAYCGLLGFTIVLNSCQDDPIVPNDPSDPIVDTTWTGGGDPMDTTFTDPTGGGGDPIDTTFNDPTGGGGTPGDTLTDPTGGGNPSDSTGG